MAREECFVVGGALVRGNPDMSGEARAALSDIITAAKARFASEPRCLCAHQERFHVVTGCVVRACGCNAYRPAVHA